MRTHFYTAKINGVWQEVYTTGKRGNKQEALAIFRKFDNTILIKNIYACYNAPSECPDTFEYSLNDKL